MWIELIVDVVAVAVITFILWKLYDDFKMRRLRRRYKEDDDPGRRPDGDNLGASGVTNQREPTTQDLDEYAKQVILSSGDGGLAVRNPKYIIRN